MGTKIQDVIAFVQRSDIDVVEITVSSDVLDYLRDKAMLDIDPNYQTIKFAGNPTSVGQLMPKDSMRVVYSRHGITTQKVFYNIKGKG